jgi:hypothetical protein
LLGQLPRTRALDLRYKSRRGIPRFMCAIVVCTDGIGKWIFLVPLWEFWYIFHRLDGSNPAPVEHPTTVARWCKWLTHCPLKAGSTGSSPVRATISSIRFASLVFLYRLAWFRLGNDSPPQCRPNGPWPPPKTREINAGTAVPCEPLGSNL